MKKARVISDWRKDIDEHVASHLTNTQHFFNACFAMVFNFLRGAFVKNGDMTAFFVKFGVIWTLVNSSSDYSTRFGDQDLFHFVLWAGFGLGLVYIAGHVNSELSYLTIACTQLWMTFGWFRVAATLRPCRPFALIHGTALLGSAVLTSMIGMGLITGSHGFLPVFLCPIASLVLSYCVPRRWDIPLNADYHVPKFKNFTIIMMIQPLSAVAAAERGDVKPADEFGFYISAGCAVLWALAFKLILSDCDTTLGKHHAIGHLSKPKDGESTGAPKKHKALTWLLVCQPLLQVSIKTCAVGITCILRTKNGGMPRGMSRGTPLVSYATAGLFLVVLLQEMQHQAEPLVGQHSDLRFLKFAWTSALIIGAAVSASLPMLEVPGLEALHVVAVLGSCVAAVGMLNKSRVVAKRKEAPDVPVGVVLTSVSMTRT